MFTVMNQPRKSKGKSTPEFSNNTNARQAQKSCLTERRKSPLSVSIDQNSACSKSENLFEELQSWSEKINCTTILILDNCDDILASASRHKFLNLISTLVAESYLKLHIIVVSSEKLFYVDSFDRWTVRELNQTVSVKMLNELAPAIDDEILKAAADLVDGCPLALKVIGQLFHVRGPNLIHKLKKESLFAIFDEVSRPEERFRVKLDVAFKRLGVLNKDCGRTLSLFPESFDEKAGNAIVHKECWEVYLKHSLLNECSLTCTFNYRYKMHKLIKQYLEKKISIDEAIHFKTKFRKHFGALLLTHATKLQEIKDADKYALSLELHNIYYLRELLSEMYKSLSPEPFLLPLGAALAVPFIRLTAFNVINTVIMLLLLTSNLIVDLNDIEIVHDIVCHIRTSAVCDYVIYLAYMNIICSVKSLMLNVMTTRLSLHNIESKFTLYYYIGYSFINIFTSFLVFCCTYYYLQFIPIYTPTCIQQLSILYKVITRCYN